MLSKSLLRARTAVVAVLFTACSTQLPWSKEAPNEVNLSFTVERNLLYLSSAEINGRPGRYLFGSANAKSVLDPSFARNVAGQALRITLNERLSRPISPLVMDLGEAGDAVIGADVFAPQAVTIDYRSGLMTWQMDGIQPAHMSLFHYDGAPSITALIDGIEVPLVVDTALPDTIVLPGPSPTSRAVAHVVIAGTDFGQVDIATADIRRARIGNRLLSKFLISIDYGRHQVGLWRDPRIPLRQ